MNATKYEVIDLISKEVIPVFKYEASFGIDGQHTVTVHLENGTPIVFDNKNSNGVLLNDAYSIREVAQNELHGTIGAATE